MTAEDVRDLLQLDTLWFRCWRTVPASHSEDKLVWSAPSEFTTPLPQSSLSRQGRQVHLAPPLPNSHWLATHGCLLWWVQGQRKYNDREINIHPPVRIVAYVVLGLPLKQYLFSVFFPHKIKAYQLYCEGKSYCYSARDVTVLDLWPWSLQPAVGLCQLLSEGRLYRLVLGLSNDGRLVCLPLQLFVHVFIYLGNVSDIILPTYIHMYIFTTYILHTSFCIAKHPSI